MTFLPPENGKANDRRQVLRALWAKERFDELARHFHVAGLRVVPWKGALFQRVLYDDIVERPITDLDPLVHPDALPQAVQCLREMGFTPVDSLLFRFSFTASNQLVFERGGEPRIELHTAVGPDPRCFDIARRWLSQPSDRRIPRDTFESPNVVIPPLEELLAALVVHYRDSAMALAWYQREDLLRLIARFPLDVNAFVRSCQEHRCILAAAVCFDDLYPDGGAPVFVTECLNALPFPAHAAFARRLLADLGHGGFSSARHGMARTASRLLSHALLLQDGPTATMEIYQAQVEHLLAEASRFRREGKSLRGVLARLLRLG